MSDILTIKNLEKVYVTDSESLTVLKGLSLNVAEGSKITIVGESGSGKSTLLNIIGGIDSATAGSVKAGEWEVTSLNEAKMSEYRSHFTGLIFQFHYLLKDFTALENVYMPALIAGMQKKEAMERAAQLLKDVGVAERRDHLPSQLSGGERQRVAVARALINDPSLILADEPTGNLDNKMVGEIMRVFERINAEEKTTIILITHNDVMVEYNPKRTITIESGHVVSDKRYDDIRPEDISKLAEKIVEPVREENSQIKEEVNNESEHIEENIEEKKEEAADTLKAEVVDNNNLGDQQ